MKYDFNKMSGNYEARFKNGDTTPFWVYDAVNITQKPTDSEMPFVTRYKSKAPEIQTSLSDDEWFLLMKNNIRNAGAHAACFTCKDKCEDITKIKYKIVSTRNLGGFLLCDKCFGDDNLAKVIEYCMFDFYGTPTVYQPWTCNIL